MLQGKRLQTVSQIPILMFHWIMDQSLNHETIIESWINHWIMNQSLNHESTIESWINHWIMNQSLNHESIIEPWIDHGLLWFNHDTIHSCWFFVGCLCSDTVATLPMAVLRVSVYSTVSGTLAEIIIWRMYLQYLLNSPGRICFGENAVGPISFIMAKTLDLYCSMYFVEIRKTITSRE